MIRRILRMLWPYRLPIGIGLVSLLLATPAQMFHPLVWMFVVDEVIGNSRTHLLVPAMVAMFAVHLIGAALSAARTWLLGRAGQRFVADLRDQLHRKLMGQSLAYHHDRQSGEQVARVIGDVDTLQDVVINGVDSVLANILGLIWVSTIIVWLDWRVGTITLAPLALVAVLTWWFNRYVKTLYRAIRDRLGDLSGHLQEQLQGILVIKAFAREGFERDRFAVHNQAYLNESLRGVSVRSVYFPSVMTVGFITNIAMIGVGAYFVLQGEFTVGGLVAYRGYWWHLFSPVFTLAQVNEMLQRAAASASRVFEVLDAPETVQDAPDAADLEVLRGAVSFDDAAFAYDSGPPVLDGVSFEVQPGERIGIVGPSGAGKSTVLNLTLRLYDCQSGAVRLDGRDVRSLRQASLRSHMGVVSQEPFLFNDTVLENIRFGRLDATRDEVEAAARRANAHDFIESLSAGYETRVGERGVKLSGGQKQRICIARAFLANPRILLLDEATAAVEPESEHLILTALERLEEGRTAIIVSHRLPLVRDCDAILVLRDGKIAERGTHGELMTRGGWYARMYLMQVEGVVS